MEGRRQIILVDAILEASEVGSIMLLGDGDGFMGLEDRQEHAHHLCVVQAIRLLRLVSPSLRTVRFTLITIAIDSAWVKPGLSPVLAARMPQILDRVLRELA
jgi:Ni,Fe-hydrogenase maturation factor